MNHTKIIGFILTVPAALAAMAEKAAPAAGAQGDSDRLGTAVAILVLAAAIGGIFLWLESEPCGNGWRTTGWD